MHPKAYFDSGEYWHLFSEKNQCVQCRHFTHYFLRFLETSNASTKIWKLKVFTNKWINSDMTSYTIAVYLFVHFQSPHSLHCIASHRIVSPYLACSSSLYRCAHSMAWVPLNQLDVHWTVDIIWMLKVRARVCVYVRERMRVWSILGTFIRSVCDEIKIIQVL